MNISLERYCITLHNGQWFTFQDPETGKTGEKSIDTLRLTEYGQQQGYSLPTQAEFDAWVQQQEQLEADQEVVRKRLKEYGSPAEQLEKIYEEGIDAWRAHIAEVKANNPK